MNFYFDVLKKYADFKGRAARQEYWMFFLINVVINLCLSGVDFLLFTKLLAVNIKIFSTLYGLFILVPGLAVAARRLHDHNLSGYYLLLGLIPLVGIVVLIILLAQKGTQGENRFGADPKQ